MSPPTHDLSVQYKDQNVKNVSKMHASIFETAVRDYLGGLRDWDSVHQLALDMEVEGVDFPAEVRRPMEDLHWIFLTADSRDDPQFRADREEISELLTEVDRLSTR